MGFTFTFTFPLILSTTLYRHQSKILVQYSPDVSEPQSVDLSCPSIFNNIVSTFRDSFRRMWTTSSRRPGRFPITPTTALISLRRNKPVFSLSKAAYFGGSLNATPLHSFHVNYFAPPKLYLTSINT